MPTESPVPVVPMQDLSNPGDAPRAVTPAVKRAIWSEPRVRQWWLSTLLIFVLFAGYTIDRLWERNDEVKLIRDGLPVDAALISAENRNKNQLTQPTDLVNLKLLFPGHPESASGYLSKPWRVEVDTVKLRVDPKDHTRWTDRTEPTPLQDSLIVGLLLSPLLPLFCVVVYLKVKAVEKVYRTGNAQQAVVFDRKQSAIAPMSFQLRCSLPGQKKDLFGVFVPQIGRGLKKGDTVWVITPVPKGPVMKGPALSGLWMGCGSVHA